MDFMTISVNLECIHDQQAIIMLLQNIAKVPDWHVKVAKQAICKSFVFHFSTTRLAQ